MADCSWPSIYMHMMGSNAIEVYSVYDVTELPEKTGENKSKIDLSQLTKKHVLHFVPSWCDYIHTYIYYYISLVGLR